MFYSSWSLLDLPVLQGFAIENKIKTLQFKILLLLFYVCACIIIKFLDVKMFMFVNKRATVLVENPGWESEEGSGISFKNCSNIKIK
jgi:hypothetical protein